MRSLVRFTGRPPRRRPAGRTATAAAPAASRARTAGSGCRARRPGRRQGEGRETLAGEAVDGPLAGGRVLAAVGDRVEPGEQLRVEVLEAGEAPAREEAVPEVADRALDLALGAAPGRGGRGAARSRSGRRSRAGRGCSGARRRCAPGRPPWRCRRGPRRACRRRRRRRGRGRRGRWQGRLAGHGLGVERAARSRGP